MDLATGGDTTWQHKEERSPLFQPTPGFSNINGAPNSSTFQQSYQQGGIYKNNVGPY